jgi:superfamily II DNA or RNA helicase
MHGIQLDVTDQTVAPRASFSSTITLRPYQQGIPDDLARTKGGIIKLGTGTGKSIIALKLMEILGYKTLIIVPKLDLLDQFKTSYEQYFGEQPGIIQGNKFEIKSLTIATSQTLVRRINAGLLAGSEFGCIIADECHLFVPEKTRKCINHFSARYRFGLSATPERTDGHGEAIKFIFGDILVDKGLTVIEPKVRLVENKKYIQMGEYHDIIENQTTCEERNKIIINQILQSYDGGRTTLVLTKRIAHYEQLMLLLSEARPNIRSIALASSTSRRERERIMEQLRGEHSFNVIFGTASLLAVGIDMPSLDTLVVACDLKSSVLTTQAAGRILRLFEGKKDPIIIDIQDTNNFVLKRQAKERVKLYKELGWKFIK